ncbi:transcription antitermination factor NusB [uncultured Friedmanniella sp.]|uniref:transcription antitermination factor NusB n=1 Tax=uncultured Friedmanniella sp. TaxID=335381 RepID=UPI0035C97FF4
MPAPDQPAPDQPAPDQPAPDRVRTHLSTRSKARKRALDILFEADLRGEDPISTLDVRADLADPPVRDYTADLVRGVVRHGGEVDRRIAACMSGGWSLERMPRVDRAAARIAVYEIDHSDTPDEVAIAEAVALVGDLSTEESPAYLNGLLGAVLTTKQPDQGDDVAAVSSVADPG